MTSDRARLAHLLSTHLQTLQAYAYVIVRDFQLAEDVVQEVALALSRDLERVPVDDGELPWLKAMTRNQACKALRRRRRDEPLAPDAIDAVFAAPLPVEGDAHSELLSRLQRCLQNIRGDARGVLQLRYADGLPCEAIAQDFGRTVQAVYAILKRTRLALIACVERTTAGG